MNLHLDVSSDVDPANPSTRTTVTVTELDALRKRLAALEQGIWGSEANQPRTRKVKSRTVTVGLNLLALAVVWMVLEKPSVVHSQKTDPLTIDKNGNVGIGTTTPSVTLDVNGDVKAFSLQFPDGTTQATAAPPAGAVIAFDLSACPAGWTEYAPAYGRFIRGIDKGGAGTDPDGQRSPGSPQEDAIRNIKGSILGVAGGINLANPWGFRPGTIGAFTVPLTDRPYNKYSGDYSPSGEVGTSANFDASTVVPTAPENRPKNVALLYCRKS